MAVFYFLGNSTPTQMFGCVLQTATKTVVIDGGMPLDHVQLLELLKKKAHAHVDAWFFTHPHGDHIGAFLEISQHHPEITVERILHHFPPVDALKKYEPRTAAEMKMWDDLEELLNGRFRNAVCRVEAGNEFWFDELNITVLRIFNPQILPNFVNNSSTVYRVQTPQNRVLVLGDLGVEGGNELQHSYNAKDLYAEYTQMAHHGQGGVSREFYEYIRPKRCLWPAPDWLWDNDNGGGFNSGPWKTVHTREWMRELGVTEHIVEKDGTVKIAL